MNRYLASQPTTRTRTRPQTRNWHQNGASGGHKKTPTRLAASRGRRDIHVPSRSVERLLEVGNCLLQLRFGGDIAALSRPRYLSALLDSLELLAQPVIEGQVS